MKISKINKIKNFGVFKNFSWKADVKDFSDFNVFYGWNYSGKTTLSRILKCFETKTKHLDYASAKFEIEDDCTGIHSEALLDGTLSVRVFNSDYVVDNLKWYGTQDGIEPILLLGQESIELIKELEKEKDNLKKTKLERENSVKDKDSKVAEMNLALTNKAREIKEDLSISAAFTKTQFERKVKEVVIAFRAVELNETAIKTLKETYQNSEKKSEINKITIDFPDIKFLNREIAELLKITVKSNVIEKLKNNHTLNDWVRTGKSIHKNKDNCEFCGNELPDDLIKRLNEHFSTEYDDLLQKLDTEIRKMNEREISVSFPDSSHLYQQLQGKYLESTEEAKSRAEELNNYLKGLSKQLRQKKQKPFERTELENINSDFKAIDQATTKVNRIINEHNQKNKGFEKEKRDAREALIDYYTQRFVEDNKFVGYQEELLKIDENISDLNKEVKNIQSKITGYEKKLSDTVKGAEKINEYLFQYFGKKDIKVIVNDDEKFQLTRTEEIAKNLSEGEKTAIAFAYFIASLENKDTRLSETIVFIDDPISSLDSNHLFNTYSFIKNVFHETIPKAARTNKKHIYKAAQLFISTHNFEFFNLLKDWIGELPKADKEFYLIEKVNTTGEKESIIKSLPEELMKYKSEYLYLFSVIYEFHINFTTDFKLLYSLPNFIRRFIETFCAFKYLATKFEEKLGLFIKDKVKRERVRKFAHYYSHSLGKDKFMEFSDPTESREIVNIVIEALNESDPEHCATLIAQVIPR